MKCPHCNQEHPEGTKFCPFEGKEIHPQLKSCPNPQCVNYGKDILPYNYKFCPQCNTMLSKEEIGESGKNQTNEVIIAPVPEKKYKIVLLSADESIFPTIDRIAGTDISGSAKRWWLSRNMNDIFPYTLYDGERVVESKAKSLKDNLEALGAKVELQRLDSSTVADFSKGRIFAKNLELGKTKLEELLTQKYRKTYGENLDDWMEEDVVELPFEVGDGVEARVIYVNPKLCGDAIPILRGEYVKIFNATSAVNFDFILNHDKKVNVMETSFEAFPCFAEMGIDEQLFYGNDGCDERSEEEIMLRFIDIMEKNGWNKIPNFFIQRNFLSDIPSATFKCTKKDPTGNDVFMILDDNGWHDNLLPSGKIIFVVNIVK